MSLKDSWRKQVGEPPWDERPRAVLLFPLCWEDNNRQEIMGPHGNEDRRNVKTSILAIIE